MDGDPRVPVAAEVDRLLDRYASFDAYSANTLDDVLEKLQDLQNQLEAASNVGEEARDGPALSSEQVSSMTAMMAQVKELTSVLPSKHREIHAVISKVGKAIDRNFMSTYQFLLPPLPFLRDETRPKLHEVICNHLCREGMQDTAEQLMKDSNLDLNAEFTSTFQEVNTIVKALRQRELGPAMEWAAANRDKLKEKKSSLEFKLHRLAFISMLAQGSSNIASAVEYARTHLTPYIQQHEEAIQQAMGALVFMRHGLSGTPYNDLLQPSQWDDLINTFTNDACAVMGLAVNSPLAVCINAGCVALPVLLNINQALNDQQVHCMWNRKEDRSATDSDELPIEITMGPSAYHSVFSCPILRSQSTEANPPMRLVCGHVISREALNKLTQANKYASNMAVRLKCPYCPVEQSPMECKQITF